ncbi:HNH endonuclease [Mesorhizobium xinjiangense]|uniref:HNH endonuclease n=1 Tax=Mesorhizobium xinjiangense TaxID=2678685 RepID=UPI001F1685F1|nr:HNH endonuclease [Mesorhizobium xinjiangense]
MPQMPGTFRPKHMPSRQEQRREHDQRRGSARERGYTTAWDKAARGFKRSHPLCLGCHAVGRVKPTEVVDHVVPHRGDNALFWDRTNWQASCHWHHDAVKQRLELLFDQGKLKQSDLRLDSDAAMKLTLDLDPR